MSNIARMMQRATAGAAGAGLDVDEVFSTYLYDGNNTGQSIVNGIDLSGEGGLVWTKARDYTVDHALVDTVRGNTKFVQSNSADDEETTSVGITAFNSTGYTLGADNTWKFNVSNSYVSEYVSWTFRKAPKFFDVVKYNGTGSTQNISHNLGVVPAMIMVKGFDSQSDSVRWNVFHKDASPNGTPQNGRMALNTTDAYNEHPTVSVFQGLWNNTAPTDSVFTVGSYGDTNGSGQEFIAYLFAHNDGDGEFGPDSDADIIKCGTYTGNGALGNAINLGFEPQWLLVKNASSSANWNIVDAMRGTVTGGIDALLFTNTNAAEANTVNRFKFTATGFEPETEGNLNSNHNGDTYIYMAIRRGGMQTPTTASDVFAINVRSSSDGEGKYTSGFPVDFSLANNYDATGNTFAGTRLLNEHLQTNDNVTAGSSASDYEWDHNDGVSIGASGGFFGGSTNNINWMWKRARGYFDVVVYEGPDSTGNFSHNLGVVPEMIWVKNTDATENWAVYHKDLGNTYYLHLNTNAAASNTDGGNFWNSTTPTASVFSVGTSTLTSHYTRKHVAYLFATAAGVSKVGSYTGNGSSQNIDCGFSSGARFVLIKRSSNAQDWYIFDSTRGIVAGNDPYLKLNTTDSEATAADEIDPLSSGFTIHQTGSAGINFDTHTYIFYAIA